MKLNVLLDLHADLPAFASLHEGDRHEVASLDEIPVFPGGYYVMDAATSISCVCTGCTPPARSSSRA